MLLSWKREKCLSSLSVLKPIFSLNISFKLLRITFSYPIYDSISLFLHLPSPFLLHFSFLHNILLLPLKPLLFSFSLLKVRPQRNRELSSPHKDIILFLAQPLLLWLWNIIFSWRCLLSNLPLFRRWQRMGLSLFSWLRFERFEFYWLFLELWLPEVVIREFDCSWD